MTEGIACECVPQCVPGRKLVDGLEFQVPTWCNTPQPWNSDGSWIKDPDGERIKAAIREVCDLDALEEILNSSEPTNGGCKTFWGSHGCDLDEDHPGVWHVCGPRDEPCMAAANWGESSIIPWTIDCERDEWDTWGLYWEWYS